MNDNMNDDRRHADEILSKARELLRGVVTGGPTAADMIRSGSLIDNASSRGAMVEICSLAAAIDLLRSSHAARRFIAHLVATSNEDLRELLNRVNDPMTAPAGQLCDSPPIGAVDVLAWIGRWLELVRPIAEASERWTTSRAGADAIAGDQRYRYVDPGLNLPVDLAYQVSLVDGVPFRLLSARFTLAETQADGSRIDEAWLRIYRPKLHAWLGQIAALAWPLHEHVVGLAALLPARMTAYGEPEVAVVVQAYTRADLAPNRADDAAVLAVLSGSPSAQGSGLVGPNGVPFPLRRP